MKGDKIVYVAGRHVLYETLDQVLHFDCASDMIEFIGHDLLLPDSQDKNDALMTYAKIYTRKEKVTLRYAMKWDNNVRTNPEPFVAWCHK